MTNALGGNLVEELAEAVARLGRGHGSLAYEMHLLGDELRHQRELLDALLALLIDEDFADACVVNPVADFIAASCCRHCPLERLALDPRR